MRVYWLVMSGLLLFPWSLVILPTIALAYKRVAPAPHRRNRRKPLVWIVILLVTILAGATAAFAAEPTATPIERLHDGVKNLATGWLRLFQVIGAETFLLPVPRPRSVPSEPGTLLEVQF